MLENNKNSGKAYGKLKCKTALNLEKDRFFYKMGSNELKLATDIL